MIRINFKKELYEALKDEAEIDNRTQVDFIRLAVKLLIEERRKQRGEKNTNTGKVERHKTTRT